MIAEWFTCPAVQDLGYFDRIRDGLSLRGNIPPLLLSSIIEGSAWNMHEVVWQPYILSLGGTTATVGALNALSSAVWAMLQFATGPITDALGRKKIIIAYYGFSVMGLIFSLLAGSWIHLIPVILLYGVADALGDPAFPPMYAESVDEEKMGLALSLLSLTWWLPGLYSQVIGGYLGDHMGVRQVITVTLVLEVLAFVIFWAFVKETLKVTKPFRLDSIKENLKGLLRPMGTLRDFYLMSVLDRFSWAISGSIFVTIIFRTYGFSLLEIGVLLTAMSTTTAILVVPVGKLVDRYGSVLMIKTSTILAFFTFLMFNFTTDFTAILLVQILRGVTIALWDPSSNAYLSKNADPVDRGRHFGNLNGLKGLAAIPAPIIGAYIFESYGITGAFTASTVGLLVVAILAMRLKEYSQVTF